MVRPRYEPRDQSTERRKMASGHSDNDASLSDAWKPTPLPRQKNTANTNRTSSSESSDEASHGTETLTNAQIVESLMEKSKPAAMSELAATDSPVALADRLEADPVPDEKEPVLGLSNDVKEKLKTRTPRSRAMQNSGNRNDTSSLKTFKVKVKWKQAEFFSAFNVPLQGGYTSLMKQIRKIQPDFDDFLTYKDDDGDMILMSSDEEFARVVVLPSSQPVLRLYAEAQNLASSAGEVEPADKAQKSNVANRKTAANDSMVKVKWKHQKSCRRLEIPAEIEYSALLGILKEMEPSFHEQLAYTDDDGDVTIISSNAELASAICLPANKQLLRLFTYNPEESNQPEQKPVEPIKQVMVLSTAPAEPIEKPVPKTNVTSAAADRDTLMEVDDDKGKITLTENQASRSNSEATFPAAVERDPAQYFKRHDSSSDALAHREKKLENCSEESREEYGIIMTRNIASLPDAERSRNVLNPKKYYIKELKIRIHELMASYGMEIHVDDATTTEGIKSHTSETSSDSDSNVGREGRIRSTRNREHRTGSFARWET